MPDAPAGQTHEKALRINLDRTVFGSFAEIGAGQEVARWFLRVGAASGTVAKTISAYDKEVSDALYGEGTRYVSRERLEAMLDAEWAQLHDHVGASRAATTRLFAFADTVATRNFEGTNDAHGWMGVRFQARPGGAACDLVLHVNMRDTSAVRQQEALGELGVNLVHAIFYERGSLDQFLGALLAGVEPGRLEIDLVDAAGADLPWRADEALAGLVVRGMAQAVLFPREGRATPPGEAFYKAAVVLAPGTFERPATVHARVLRAGAAALERELAVRGGEAPPVARAFCLSAAGAGEDGPGLDPPEVLGRAAQLAALGSPVLATPHREYYHMTALVNRGTREPLRFAVGVAALLRVFSEVHYKGLEGQTLEGLSRLFAGNVRIGVCPMPEADVRAVLAGLAGRGWRLGARDGLVGADGARPPDPIGHLYDYLLHSGFLVPLIPEV